jgi:hypothetical protein
VDLTDARILYKPDFKFTRGGKEVWAECKGFETAIWRIKKRLWKFYGPGTLEIYKVNKLGPYLDEEVFPGRSRG